MKIIFQLLIILVLGGIGDLYGQDFVYNAKNPAFGGNPYNYTWLMNSAQAQNDIKETATGISSNYKTNPVNDFAESLNRQILSQLSRQIVSRQFGEESLKSGTYILGDYQIEIGDQSNGLNISILDNKTGSTTTVSVPFF